MAIPTTPPYCEGGAPVGDSVVAGWSWAALTRARAAASMRAWRLRSASWSSAIWSSMEERSCWRCASELSISALWAARAATASSCFLRAFASSASRVLISARNFRTSLRICAS